MNRFIRLPAIAALSLAASLAHALDIEPYTPAALSAAQQAGNRVYAGSLGGSFLLGIVWSPCSGPLLA